MRRGQEKRSESSLPTDAVKDELMRRAASLALEPEEEAAEDLLGLLLFRLGEEWYAVRVDEVREIYQEYTVTPIPCVPEYVEGVINIRGEIVSVTDIGRLMSLPPIEAAGVRPAIVVSGDSSVTAMLVDDIGDIVEMSREGVEPPVSMIGKAQAEFVSGSVYVDGRLVGLVNLHKVLQPIGGSE